ncbi:hypothetical protein JHK86_016459 [Glycine max]|nr:hypothetical protein JHK86_016459 [Glycine max]
MINLCIVLNYRIWLKSHCRRQRWAGKSYKNSHLGNEWKKLFAGSSHAKGIVLEKIVYSFKKLTCFSICRGIEAKQPNFAIDKCARVQLIKNWKKIAAFFPNDGFLSYIEANVSACLCLLVSLLSYLYSWKQLEQYGLWERYAKLSPDKYLIYTIGVSDYTKDWLFAQKDDNKYQGTTWQIKFKLDSMNKSNSYKLRVALALATSSEL